MWKRLIPLAVFGVLFFATPDATVAQCNERCVAIEDAEGNHKGFGCTDGGLFSNCEATKETCSLDGCIAQAITSDEGVLLAILPRCETSELLGRIAEDAEDTFIDERYSVSTGNGGDRGNGGRAGIE
ncbi:MAG: hypothetical protein F4Z33_08255 [Gemmatimonadales bacterium]|nr:hypothetical protein [Gemmatimonadales bacterium]